MIDISPLQDAVEAEENPEIKVVLQVALDLLGSGYTSHFTKLYKKGLHHDLMGPKGTVAFKKVINQFIEAEEELNKSMEKPKESQRFIVCGLAALGSQEGKDGTGKVKFVSKKSKEKMSPIRPRFAKSAFLRRERGKGVKIRDPNEDEKLNLDEIVNAKVEMVKVKEEVVDLKDDEMIDGEVQIINKRLFHYLVQMSEEEKEILTNL